MRITATISSFFIVLALYFLYGWVLVPFVLPSPGGNTAPVMLTSEQTSSRAEIEPFLELFPENGWERDLKAELHFLQFGQTIVLFGKDTVEGKLLRLEPCTVLILPDNNEHFGEEEIKNWVRQTVVLRTPQYAEIEFDKEFNISKMPLPNIVTGRLFGKVTVQGDGKTDGKQDDLSLETENIAITETPGSTKLETLKDVRFTMGYHSGAGTGLSLELVKTDSNDPNSLRGLSSVMFQSIKSLRFVFPEDSSAPAKVSGGSIIVPDCPFATVDARCQGRFVFAANTAEQGWTASFYQNAEIIRNNPDKTIDRLTADEVHLTLQPGKDVAANVEAKKIDLGKMEPVLFVAHGKPGLNGQAPIPARLSIKQNSDITLVGDEIFLDLRKNFLSLSTWDQTKKAGGSPAVKMILADQYTIKSDRSVQYTLGQNGAFGKFVSEGKGDLTGKIGNGVSAKEVYLAWNEMQMEPHPLVKDQIVLKLGKGISARMTGFGTMTADKLELCCNYVPSNNVTNSKTSGTKKETPNVSGGGKNFTLDHAIVRDNVLFETSNGTCRVNRFDIFFTNMMPDGKVLQSRYTPQILTQKPPTPPGSTDNTIRQVQYLEPLKAMPVNPIPVAPLQSLPLYQPQVQPAPMIANRIPGSQPKPQTANFVSTQNLLGIQSSPSAGKFAMTGNLMKMQIRNNQAGQSSAEIVAFEGNVFLKENVNNAAPSMAIEIAGDTVTIWNPADFTTQIKITGKATGGDAVFRGKGVELRAKELNLSRPDNKFWSPGAGHLTANVTQIKTPTALSANPNGDKLTVEWNKEMLCDGKVLQFFGQRDKNGNRVRVLYQTQSLWCDVMEIHLNRQVMFFDDQSTIEPKAEKIRCAHDVYIRNRQVDVNQKQKSIEVASVAKLQYDVGRNFFTAEGPGEMNSTFLGSNRGFDPKSSSTVKANGGEKLNYLAVWFHDTMQGSLLGNNKMVVINGRVMAAYCPAASWDDTIAFENFAAARKTGYTLECEKLQISEVANPVNPSESSMELTAEQDAVIDGGGVYGKAQKIKYSQQKSVVNFDGNVKVRTTLQGQTSDHAAQSIQYNIETGSVNFIQAQGLSIGQ